MEKVRKQYIICRVIGLISLILSSGLTIYGIVLTRPEITVRTFNEMTPEQPFVLSTLFLGICLLVPMAGIAKEWILKDQTIRATSNAVLIFISLLLVVIYALGIYFSLVNNVDTLPRL